MEGSNNVVQEIVLLSFHNFNDFFNGNTCWLMHTCLLMTMKVNSDRIVDIFYFFSETICQIHFKLGGDLPWVGTYHACSNGYGPVICGYFMKFFGFFGGGESETIYCKTGKSLYKERLPKSIHLPFQRKCCFDYEVCH